MVIVKEVFIICHIVAAFTLFIFAGTSSHFIGSTVAVVAGIMSFIMAFFVEDVEI